MGATIIKGDGVTTYFAPGVNFESGWHDVDKTWSEEKQAWDGDGALCWAAQSSCLAAYWQDWYVKSGNSLGDHVPKTAGEIYNTFKTNWTNNGGLSEFGLSWYFSGQPPSNYATNVQNYPNSWSILQNSNSGGYFSDRYKDAVTFSKEANFLRHNNFDGDGVGQLQQGEFTEYLMDLICNQDCVIGLSLEFWGNPDAGTKAGLHGGHAVTLWGFDVDNTTGLVSAVHITDSDDKYHGLKTYSVDDGYFGYDVEFPDYLKEDVRDEYWTLTHSFYSFSVKEFTTAIPEPSAFGLIFGLGALLFAGTVRRRR